LAAPTATRRFFVTPEESGQLCLLAAAAAKDRRIVIPALDPELHLRDLVEVAEEVLGALGLEPIRCTTEDEARSQMQHVGVTGRWPILLTPLDTAGEKEFEEFAAIDDVVHDDGFQQLRTLSTPPQDPAQIDDFVVRTTGFLEENGDVTAQDIIGCVNDFVPGLRHRQSSKALDARM
jgi:FlaA1/EpsC-like NDP-sugar epimerase